MLEVEELFDNKIAELADMALKRYFKGKPDLKVVGGELIDVTAYETADGVLALNAIKSRVERLIGNSKQLIELSGRVDSKTEFVRNLSDKELADKLLEAADSLRKTNDSNNNMEDEE